MLDAVPKLPHQLCKLLVSDRPPAVLHHVAWLIARLKTQEEEVSAAVLLRLGRCVQYLDIGKGIKVKRHKAFCAAHNTAHGCICE